VTSSANKLRSLDFCARREFLERSWERAALHPTQILHRALEHGLESEESDPGQAAGDHAMTLCVNRPIETDSPDLLSIAEHVAALADMIIYAVRADNPPWVHPENAQVEDKVWKSGAFLNGNRLRKLITVDRWPEEGNLSILHSWAVQGECSIYGMEMDLLIAVVGSRRDKKWHSAWTRGWEHPVSRELRFQKRDGEPFGPTWERVWRERFQGTREDWWEGLNQDYLLPEMLLVHQIPVSAHSKSYQALAKRRLCSIDQQHSLPDPHLSQCDNAQSPCQFRSTCPYFRLPDEENGFIRSPQL